VFLCLRYVGGRSGGSSVVSSDEGRGRGVDSLKGRDQVGAIFKSRRKRNILGKKDFMYKRTLWSIDSRRSVKDDWKG